MTTPLRRQYLDIKRRYPHAILFFRMGDFYETFDEDAEVVARELEITLTSRPVSKGERVPLAGIPYHALDAYLGKLIAKGYKVAICEQTEEPSKGKKIVDRKVVRVVTPGTLVEDNFLESGRNNYLAALVLDEELAGLAWVDISTGEFRCQQADTELIRGELERLRPAELLLPQGSSPPAGLTAVLTPLPGVDLAASSHILLEHLRSESLEAIGLSGQRLAAAAAGIALDYLKANQPATVGHITRLAASGAAPHMVLDANTRRNLEIFDPLRAPETVASSRPATLLATLDYAKTAMGARLLRTWLGEPLRDVEEIARRLDSVQAFFESAVLRRRSQDILARVPDMERALARISAAAAASLSPSTPRDLLGLHRGLEAVPELRAFLETGAVQACQEIAANLHPCKDTAGLIAAALSDDPANGAAIRTGFSEELDRLRTVSRDARRYLADLEARERERTGIKTLKVGYNRVFGYYVEVSKANVGAVPADYLRKQTLVGGERYTLPELQEHEYRVLHAQELQQELENNLLRQICAQVAADAPRIQETACAVARIDVLASFAEAASRNGYVRPVVDEGNVIDIREGRHPVVESTVGEGSFVPNDVQLSSADAQVLILTGPNMAGKSTYLRQVALIVLMAQAGSFVPAREARIGLVDRIASRVGALDDIAAGHSTFMVEMVETAGMLTAATDRSLLIFDEIGRGTSTYDGMAIARAVAEFVHNRPDARSRTLFATHYHELTSLSDTLPRVRNAHVAVAEENGGVVFLHRVLPGGADRSYGVHVAQLAGLPATVVQRAQEILLELESSRSTLRGAPAESPQLALFSPPPDGLRQEVAELDVDGMTPLQAINKLYELAGKARAL